MKFAPRRIVQLSQSPSLNSFSMACLDLRLATMTGLLSLSTLKCSFNEDRAAALE